MKSRLKTSIRRTAAGVCAALLVMTTILFGAASPAGAASSVEFTYFNCGDGYITATSVPTVYGSFSGFGGERIQYYAVLQGWNRNTGWDNLAVAGPYYAIYGRTGQTVPYNKWGYHWLDSAGQPVTALTGPQPAWNVVSGNAYRILTVVIDSSKYFVGVSSDQYCWA